MSANLPEPWWVRAGVAVDQAMNVMLLDGEPDETISMHAAEAARGGERWGCVLCRWLGRMVQPHHCRDVLDGTALRTEAAIRGGILMAGVLAALWGAAHLVVALLGRAIG